MPGPIRPENTRVSVIVARTLRSWLAGEATRLGVSSSDVVRGALDWFRRQPPEVRRGIVESAMPPPEGGNGGAGPPRA